MKRKYIELSSIADLSNLASAAHKAAKAKRSRPEVQSFFNDLPSHLSKLSADILNENVPYGHFRSFSIRDPKPRLIHAACFEDRVLHHAIMNHVAPVLDKAMTSQSFACREAMGVHKAAAYALKQLRRYPYYLKLDVTAYFASISHEVLLKLLNLKLKGEALLRLLKRIVTGFESSPKCGLPIGSLCSQHFANYYLDALDRNLLAHESCRAYLRYMDDMLIFCHSKQAAKELLVFVKSFLAQERGLDLKENWQLNRTDFGVTFCGYRISPQGLGLSQRRRKRYQQRRLYWENAYKEKRISSLDLQRNVAAVQSIIQGTNTSWQHANLSLHPAIEV